MAVQKQTPASAPKKTDPRTFNWAGLAALAQEPIINKEVPLVDKYNACVKSGIAAPFDSTMLVRDVKGFNQATCGDIRLGNMIRMVHDKMADITESDRMVNHEGVVIGPGKPFIAVPLTITLSRNMPDGAPAGRCWSSDAKTPDTRNNWGATSCYGCPKLHKEVAKASKDEKKAVANDKCVFTASMTFYGADFLRLYRFNFKNTNLGAYQDTIRPIMAKSVPPYLVALVIEPILVQDAEGKNQWYNLSCVDSFPTPDPILKHCKYARQMLELYLEQKEVALAEAKAGGAAKAAFVMPQIQPPAGIEVYRQNVPVVDGVPDVVNEV